MDRRWLCAGLSVLCLLGSAKLGWFRGLVLPMLSVGFLFAVFWFWFVERMSNVSKQIDLYMPTPQELAALKQAALEKQQASAAKPAVENPLPAPNHAAIVMPPQNISAQTVVPELPKAPVPTGRAVFNLGQEAPKAQPKPPSV